MRAWAHETGLAVETRGTMEADVLSLVIVLQDKAVV